MMSGFAWWSRVLATMLVVGLLAGSASAQFQTRWNFTDSEGWPRSPDDVPPGLGLDDGDIDEGPGGGTVGNYIGNQLYFDDNNLFTAPVRSPLGPMIGDVMWGNPTELAGGAQLEFDFFNAPEFPTHVSFDFAWMTNRGASNLLDVFVSGTEGSYGTSLFLDTPFFTSGVQGESGHVQITSIDPDSEIDIGKIEAITLELADIEARIEGGDEIFGQFAIDNFIFRSGDVVPNDSELQLIFPLTGQPVNGTNFGASWLSPSSSIRWSNPILDVAEVSGLDGAEYTVVVSGPASVDAGDGVNSIFAGQTVEDGASALLELQGLPSGTYVSEVRLQNLSNSNDPDDVATTTVDLYDAASVAGNTEGAIDANGGGQIHLEAGATENREGALRAGVRIAEVASTGFSMDVEGIDVGDFIEPGDVLNGTVRAAFGARSGSRSGQLIIDGYSDIASTFLLNIVGDDAMPAVVWNVTAEIPSKSSGMHEIASGVDYIDAQIGISNPKTGAAVIGGKANSEQTVEILFTSNPDPASATLVGDAIELTGLGDLFVMKIEYDDADLPALLGEDELTVLVYDEALGAWVDAISLNSDGGAGSRFFAGSYADYLDSDDDGLPNLSAFGVDATLNHVWAVLDHNSVFGVGVAGNPVPEPSTFVLLCGVVGLVAVRRVRRFGRIAIRR